MSLERIRMVCRMMMWATFSCLLVVGPAFVFGNPPKHEEKGKAPAPAAKGKNAAPANKTMLEVVTGLHEAKLLLDTADRDYDGHRASAVGHVKSVIEDLTPLLGNKKVVTAAKKTETGPSPSTTPGLTQAQSDAQLKQAREMIAELSGHIPPKHGFSVEHVKKAIAELDIALKVK